MNLRPAKPPWQPLTFRGVAGFAQASAWYLFKTQFVVALVFAGALLWFLIAAWFPPVDQAIARLPDRGEIRAGRLSWPVASPVTLGANSFLSVALNASEQRSAGTASDLELLLGPTGFRVSSLLGSHDVGYPKGWVFSLNRPEAEAWWVAWQRAVIAGVALGSVAGLLVAWAVLAAVYAVPLRLLARCLGRELSAGGAWRLAGATLLPGALLLAVAVLGYSLHRLNLPGLLFVSAVHLPVGWVYLGIAPFFLPRAAPRPGRGGANPFATDRVKDRAPSTRNPFSGRR